MYPWVIYKAECLRMVSDKVYIIKPYK